MKVLVACEESQRVCTAFRKLGHEAYSCDIQKCSGGHPEWHVVENALQMLSKNITIVTMDGGRRDAFYRWVGFNYSTSALYISFKRDHTSFIAQMHAGRKSN